MSRCSCGSIVSRAAQSGYPVSAAPQQAPQAFAAAVSDAAAAVPLRTVRKDIDLSAASPSGGLEVQFPGGNGGGVWVNDASADFKVEAVYDDDDRSNAIIFRQGYFFHGKRYKRLRLFWAAQAGVTVTLQLLEWQPGDYLRIL